MIRRKAGADLTPWIERGCSSLVASFANGVARDIAAVRAAIVTSWSNGKRRGRSPSSLPSSGKLASLFWPKFSLFVR